MSTITAQNIIDQCKIDLKDANAKTWTETTLLRYLNAGQRAVVIRKPNAYVKTISHQLTANETKQSIPANGHMFIDLIRNMGTSGTTPGRSIEEISMVDMNKANRSWHSDTASTVVENVMKTDDPKLFYVSPPQPNGTVGYVELVYSVAPADIAIGAVLLIEDIYANAIRYYMMAQAHLKEDVRAEPILAKGYMAQFETELGLAAEE